MFPKIPLYEEDTLTSVEARLAKAIIINSSRPGIKPIYTMDSVKQEAERLHQNLPAQNLQSN